ncbi:MAG: hypothetical protein ACI9DH_000545 [Halioglobus sp.]|jgi:hypothetical protein
MGKNNKFLTGTYSDVLIYMALAAIVKEQGDIALEKHTGSELLDARDRIADFERVLKKNLSS